MDEKNQSDRIENEKSAAWGNAQEMIPPFLHKLPRCGKLFFRSFAITISSICKGAKTDTMLQALQPWGLINGSA